MGHWQERSMLLNELLTAGYSKVCRAKAERTESIRIWLIGSLFMLLNVLLFLYVLSLFSFSLITFGCKCCERAIVITLAPLLAVHMNRPADGGRG
jgi:hypothetical protein